MPSTNPVTATPNTAPATNTGGAPTIGSMYGGVSQSDQDVINAANAYKGVATTPVDEQGIRSNVINNLQAEIDATNSIYAQKLQDAKVAGANLLGSTAAQDARRGLTGSDFSTADTYNANTKNNATYSEIGNEQAAAIAAIVDKGNTEATNEISQKQTAQKNGADSYINFLNAASSRQQTRASNAAQAALSGGIDLTSAPAATIKAIADSYQIDPNALVTSFVAAKNAANTTAATLTKPIASTAGDTESQFNPATGKYDVTQGTPTDATLKEYQYAVANDNFTGSLADWNAQKANQKVSVGIQTNPLTGTQTQYNRTGPGVAGLPPASAKPDSTVTPATSLPPAPSSSTPTGALPQTKAAQLTPYSNAALPNPANKVQLTYLKDFTTGTTGKQVNALNTAVGHLFDANGIFQTLNNGALQAGNSIQNTLNTATGKAAAQNYAQAQDLVSSEIAGAYGANAVSDRQAQGGFGSAVDSPAQHAGYVKTVATFLSSKIAANVQSYRTAMGANPSSLDIFISPANQVKLAAMGINVSGLVPGLAPSQYAQQIISGAQINSKTGQVRIPDGNGGYQLLQ